MKNTANFRRVKIISFDDPQVGSQKEVLERMKGAKKFWDTSVKKRLWNVNEDGVSILFKHLSQSPIIKITEN